jgi:hypothetical protein
MFSNLATLKHPVRCLKGKGDQQFHILPTATNTQTQMDLFFEMGQPQPLHQRDAYGLLLFIYSTKTGKRPYNDHTSRNH